MTPNTDTTPDMTPTPVPGLVPDAELDLRIERIIAAPPSAVWAAWTDPAKLARWWLPAPTACRVDRLDVVPGGGFVTSMSDDGVTFSAHVDACFLVVEEGRRIVFTNALDSRWRPATPQPVAMTAEITLADHPTGTSYRALVRHGDAAARTRHDELGFADGWGAVTAQLAAVAEAGEGWR